MRRALAALAVAGVLAVLPTPADAAPTLDRLPHCPFAEATGEPGERCVWDARHMGDGAGRSFRINRAGEVRRISHDRAHQLAYGARHLFHV